MHRRNFTISRMICSNCGNEGIPIPRKSSGAREEGHMKELYCLTCREYHNHIELRSDWDAVEYEDIMKNAVKEEKLDKGVN